MKIFESSSLKFLLLLLVTFSLFSISLSQDACGCINGKCSPDFDCICNDPTKWVGQFCEVPVCNDCKNGICSSPGYCNCSVGWTGASCDTITCTEGPGVHGCNTNNGECVDADYCKCKDGYTGADCSIALCDPPCENGGICRNPGQPCDCSPTNGGWRGGACEIPICTDDKGANVCQHGSTCVGPKVCNCTLTGGWTGQQCQFDINECLTPNITTCDKKTRCINTAPGFRCTDCPSGYAGTGKTGCVPLCPNGCSNGGICGSPNTCNCTGTGYTGSTCFTDLDECSVGGFCDPQVGCINTVGSFSCVGACPDGYVGNPYMSKGGCKPVCTQACQEGFFCSAPDVCSKSFAQGFIKNLSILLLFSLLIATIG